MNNKTVVTYSEEDFESGSIKGKKSRSSVFIPLICSIVAAFALWLFVIWGNNTCTGIAVEVLGNEQLLSNNYTVSSIEPSNIDLVFRGKSDVIQRITKDPSLVTAYVNVFGDDSTPGVFDSVENIKPGEYTVELKISVPDGVSCGSKTVKVTIAEAGSKTFSTADADLSNSGPVRLNMSNYSFANGISLDRLMIMEESVTVIGDQNKVEAIDYISLKVDWLKDFADDATIYVTPVACDKYGDEVDAKFLRFKPASVEVDVKVTKQKIIHLKPRIPEGEGADYSLSVDTLKVIGPVLEIDRLKDTIEIPVDQNLAEKKYELQASDLGSSIRFVTEEGERSTITIVAQKRQRTFKTTLTVSAKDIILLSAPDSGYVYELDKEEYSVDVRYVVIDPENSEITSQNLVAILDLSDVRVGSNELSLKIAFLPDENVERYVLQQAEGVKVTVTVKQSETNE